MGAPFSLYLHIPFCASKCGYCDFYSIQGADDGLMERYLSALKSEIRYTLDRFQPENITTLFIGGGTPTLLSDGLLEGLFLFLEECLPGGMPREVTVESNPETVTASKLTALTAGGVTRLSLGVQSLQPRALDLLQRRAGRDTILKALSLLKREWHGGLNVDLIGDIPGQTRADLSRSLDAVLAYNPDHVSLYGLTLEAGTPLGRAAAEGTLKQIPLTAEEWGGLIRQLSHSGYAQYEIANFARPGQECRHNMAYWRMENWAACGPSASSTLVTEGRAYRFTRPPSLKNYLAEAAAGWSPAYEAIPPADFLFEHFMMGLRLNEGLDLAAVGRRFGLAPEVLAPEAVAAYRSRGWLEKGSPGRLKTTLPGQFMLNTILIDIAAELESLEVPDLKS